MARYIDADALVKKMFPMGIGDGMYTINAKVAKFVIDNAPTADVAPKSESEFDRIPVENAQALKEKAVEKAKAEVARMILEELEMAIHHAIGGWKNEIRFSISREETKLIAERVGALQYCLYEIAKLKKKYTGEQT